MHVFNRRLFPKLQRTVRSIDPVITGVDISDVSESDEVILLASFTAGTEIQVDLEAELALDGEDRYCIGSSTLVPTGAQGDHAIVVHGGLPLRAMVTSVTGDAVSLTGDQTDGATDGTGLIFTDADATFTTNTVAVGDNVVVAGTPHLIETVDSQTQLTLAAGHALGASQSGLTYTITRTEVLFTLVPVSHDRSSS